MPSARSSLSAASFAVFLGAIAAGRAADAQNFGRRGREIPDRPRVQLPTDRTVNRGMQQAAEQIAAGEFSQAIAYLDEILGRDEDKFVERSPGGEMAGLKETARQLIRDLPPEGRRAYETAFGPAAERLLKSAIEAGDSGALGLVAQRYFYTPAGYQAAFLQAMDEADAGRHLSAALIYQQLLQSPEAVKMFDPQLSVRAAASWLAAGEPDHARAVISALVARGQQMVEIGGRKYKLDSDTKPITWLREAVGQPADAAVSHERQWLTYRGNAARNGTASGGLPHMRVRWKVRLLGHPQLETLFENLFAEYARTGNIAPIASGPLAAGDYIITRTPHGLLAVDFTTGKRVWRSEPQRDPELERLMHAAVSEEEAANPEPARSFARRMWEDYLYGLTSSDGARVYMIRDLPMPQAQDFEAMPFMGAPGMEEKAQTNRLSAYELATQGKLVWEIDGATAAGELAGVFFLGAPLPVDQTLFVLAEKKSSVYLLAIDRTTGELQWQQGLVDMETGVGLDLRRRLQSAMPSYESGIIVCPTGAGVVIGVDLAKRSLAWACQFETTRRLDDIYRRRQDDGGNRQLRRWTDSSVTIVGDRVLLTPPESSSLHCIELHTGRVLWKHSRGDMNRLACVDGDRVLLVGNRKLEALQLADGKSAWKEESLNLPRGVSPSGTGFLSKGVYYLPLTSAEVVGVNVAEGKIISRTEARDGMPLGNLICHRGAVISQNGEFLDCFDQIEVLRKRSEEQLANNPNDVPSLRTLGEIAYNEGRLSEAITLLTRAYQAAEDELETRDVLAECLTAALDEDFAAYREQLPLLAKLDDGSPTRRMMVLRIEAQGLLHEGDPVASAASCIELFRLAGQAGEMIKVGRGHESAVSRWVESQLAAIWEKASADEQAAVQKQVQAEVDKLGADPQGEELARFLEFFGSVPAAERLKLARARELMKSDQSLDGQQLLLDLTSSNDQAIRAEAVARIAAHLHESNHASLASEYDAELAGPLADVKCLDGATGRELVEKWAAFKAAALGDWPTGRVDVRMMPVGAGNASSRVRSPMFGVRLERTDSILGLCSAQLMSRGNELVIADGSGREMFTASLEPENGVPYRPPNAIYGVSRGNLLVVSFGKQLVAFNTLAAAEGLSPPLLWRANLGASFERGQEFYPEANVPGQNRPGSYRAPRLVDEGKWIGVIGPVTSRGVIFQDQRRLVCVDPISGEVRWSRSDVPPGCDLFGDEQYVFVTPTGSTTATVYSTVDGRQVGERKVPVWREQLVTRGRNIVCWKANDQKRLELSSIDALTGETAWKHDFAPTPAIDIDLGRYVAVVQPHGRTVIIDAVNGSVLVDQPGPDTPTIEEVHLTASHEDFTLVVKTPLSANVRRNVRSLMPWDSPTIDGLVFVFDRASGKMRWNKPAEVVQQGYPLSQPVDLPFIVFASQLMSQDGSGSRNTSSLLLIDKATGRTLLADDELPQSGAGQCIAKISDAASHQATVEMAGRTILLQFTAERRPPEPPATAEVESAGSRSGGGLIGILQKLGGS
jgi:outer membrane protein assembly factor BamB